MQDKGIRIVGVCEMTKGWEGWKLPDNWKEIIEEHVEMFDRLISRWLAEPDMNDETRKYLAAWRRGTFFMTKLEEKLR